MKLLTLTIIDGPLAGKNFTVAPGATLHVGRSRTAELFVMDPGLSRIHFALSWERDEWLLRDLSSRNGVKLNGRAVEAAPVGHCDVIAAGLTTFQIRIEDPASTGNESC